MIGGNGFRLYDKNITDIFKEDGMKDRLEKLEKFKEDVSSALDSLNKDSLIDERFNRLSELVGKPVCASIETMRGFDTISGTLLTLKDEFGRVCIESFNGCSYLCSFEQLYSVREIE